MTTLTCNAEGAKSELLDEGLQGGASAWQVIAYTHQWDGGQGMLPYGIVLAFQPNNYDPFVTWRVAKSDRDGKWYAESGHYHRNIIEAANDYEKRGGK